MKKTKNKQPGAASSPASRPARVRVGANKEGFTLVELLVVIAIIGLLSSIILVAVSKARQTAKQATAVANIKYSKIFSLPAYGGVELSANGF